MISWIIKSRPPTGANTGAAWPGAMETKATQLSKWYGIADPSEDWQNQPTFKNSKAEASIDTMGAFPEAVQKAAGGGAMTAEVFDAADSSTSKAEGRRMRSLANEQQFRRKPAATTKKYALSGIRQSAKMIIDLAGLHPNLAAGFYYISKKRQGSFVTWKDANHLVSLPSFYGKLASTTAATGCPCCKNDNVADSFGHFIFECDHPELKKIRADLGITEFATMVAAEVSRQQTNRNDNDTSNNNINSSNNNNNNNASSSTTTSTATTTNPNPNPTIANSNSTTTSHVRGTRLTRSTAALHADAKASLLIGERPALQNTGSTAAATTSTAMNILDLKNWQPVKGNDDHAELQKKIDTILADTHDNQRRQDKKRRTKKKKIQNEHPLFEASTVILAQYLQVGMAIRQRLVWVASTTSQRNSAR